MNSDESSCSKCGAALDEQDRFCGQCGQPVAKTSRQEGAASRSSTTQRGSSVKETVVERKRSHFGRKLLIVGLVVIVMVGIGAWAGYEWVISRPVNIDTSQLLPQAVPSAQPQPQPGPDSMQQAGPDESGKTTRGWLGVSAQDVPWEVASRIGMATPSGALVNGCEPGGPAEKAGISPGDVLLEMNGVQLASARDLRERASGEWPGKTVQFLVWRDGSTSKTSVLVAERPPTNLDRQKRSEARQYASTYEACFARFCPGCNSPLDLFKEQTPECQRCQAAYKGQIDSCAAAEKP